MLPAAVLFGLASWLMLERVLQAPSAALLMQAQILAATAMAFIWGPTPALMTEVLPVNIRSTGVSLAYNFGVMLFGGLAPFINTALIEYTHDRMVPAYYMLVCVAIGVAGLLLLKQSHMAAAAPAAARPAP